MGKIDSVNRRYQIMVINILKNLSHIYSNHYNWSHRHSIHYIIKFIDFISIYYAINLDVVLFFIILSNLYLRSIDLSSLNQ